MKCGRCHEPLAAAQAKQLDNYGGSGAGAILYVHKTYCDPPQRH